MAFNTTKVTPSTSGSGVFTASVGVGDVVVDGEGESDSEGDGDVPPTAATSPSVSKPFNRTATPPTTNATSTMRRAGDRFTRAILP